GDSLSGEVETDGPPGGVEGHSLKVISTLEGRQIGSREEPDRADDGVGAIVQTTACPFGHYFPDLTIVIPPQRFDLGLELNVASNIERVGHPIDVPGVILLRTVRVRVDEV